MKIPPVAIFSPLSQLGLLSPLSQFSSSKCLFNHLKKINF